MMAFIRFLDIGCNTKELRIRVSREEGIKRKIRTLCIPCPVL